LLYKRMYFAIFLIVLANLVFFSAKSTAKMEVLEPVATGIWFREGDGKRWGHCNNIVIEMKDYLIVVDANFPSGARFLMEDIKKISSKPVKYVFDTHHHGDHSYGNALWTKAGATTLAYKAAADEMKRVEPGRWQRSAKDRPDMAEMKVQGPEFPKQTIEQSPFVLQDSTRRVEFHFFGWAHTRGDGFVYLPKEKVLCTGDVITNGPYNGTGEAYIGNWAKVVRQAMKLDVKIVLPGHGLRGGRELMVGQEAFMREMYDTVKTAVSHGKKLEDLVTMRGTQPVAAKFRLSAAANPWAGDFFAAQIKDTFQEIQAGKPRGDITSGNVRMEVMKPSGKR
jgi:cyclase